MGDGWETTSSGWKTKLTFAKGLCSPPSESIWVQKNKQSLGENLVCDECDGLNWISMQHADRQTAKQKGKTYCWTSPNTSAQVSPQLQERREAPKDSIQTSQTDQTYKQRQRQSFLSNRNPSRGALAFSAGKKKQLRLLCHTLNYKTLDLQEGYQEVQLFQWL